MRQTAGVNRGKAPRQNLIAGRAPRQTAATEPHRRTCAEVKRRDRNAIPARTELPNANRGQPSRQERNAGCAHPPPPPIPHSEFRISPAVPRAHNRLCRSYNRPVQRPRRLTIQEHMKTIGTEPRQRGITQRQKPRPRINAKRRAVVRRRSMKRRYDKGGGIFRSFILLYRRS